MLFSLLSNSPIEYICLFQFSFELFCETYHYSRAFIVRVVCVCVCEHSLNFNFNQFYVHFPSALTNRRVFTHYLYYASYYFVYYAVANLESLCLSLAWPIWKEEIIRSMETTMCFDLCVNWHGLWVMGKENWRRSVLFCFFFSSLFHQFYLWQLFGGS